MSCCRGISSYSEKKSGGETRTLTLDQTASLDAQTWETLTDNPDIGQGSSMPPNGDHTGTASHLGK